VTDIPVPVMFTIEHRAESKRCACGTVTKAAFPTAARGHASYGPRVRATALYLLGRQHLPFERTKEAMADLLGVRVSTGFLDSVYSEGADGLAGFLTAVLAQLRDADVVYMDETSDRLGKGSVWFHVACTELLTLLHADNTRGPDGIEATGLLPDFDGVAVHDRLGWYFDYDQPTHAACGASSPQPGLGRGLLRPDRVDQLDGRLAVGDEGRGGNRSCWVQEEDLEEDPRRLPRPLRHDRRRSTQRQPTTHWSQARQHRDRGLQPRTRL